MRLLSFFGPGAVIASLTIGSGELIFSSRAGSLFGYRALWVFALVLIAKWVLVYTSARHIVLSGGHPFQRWMELPGPRGWLPFTFLFLALICFPIWVCFHAATLGTLIAAITNSRNSFSGAMHFVYGGIVLILLVVLALRGGYAALEKIQLVIIILMLLAVTAALLMLHPDWTALMEGFAPRQFSYPEWARGIPEISNRSLWVEIITYVGVLGGSSYDYLAYVSYLRDKRWGNSSAEVAATEDESARGWLRALQMDTALSFIAVLLFTLVFVACGAMLLRDKHEIPSGGDLLTLQAAFITPLAPQLASLYFLGAFLTILGTLYGTIEVAPAIFRELLRAIRPVLREREQKEFRKLAILWVSIGGFFVLLVNALYTAFVRPGNPPALIVLLTPANLFTGVLGCGFICLLSPWISRRWGKPLPLALLALNVIFGAAFLIFGIYGYYEHSGWKSIYLLLGTIAVGFLCGRYFTAQQEG